jgi:hypothetical protein
MNDQIERVRYFRPLNNARQPANPRVGKQRALHLPGSIAKKDNLD